MQSRILQVTHLGNFRPWLLWHIVGDDHTRKAERRGVLSVVPVNCTIASLRFIPAGG